MYTYNIYLIHIYPNIFYLIFERSPYYRSHKVINKISSQIIDLKNMRELFSSINFRTRIRQQLIFHIYS